MQSLQRDFVHGLRSFSRSPVFASIFVITLAVGIGAATSVFTLPALKAMKLDPMDSLRHE